MNQFDTLIYEKQNGIGYITLNRPQVLNAYNTRMRDELTEVVSAIKWDCEIMSVIIKGAGEKAFCAGADLTEFLTSPSPTVARKVRWERDIWGLLLELPQPLIAALHGYVLGSGIEIAMCCDLRIASEDCKFGLPEIGLGIIPAAGGTQTIPRTVGRVKALELLMTGKIINAEEANRIRLVNMVVPAKELLPRAENIARKINSHDHETVKCIKLAVNHGSDLSLLEGLRLEKRLSLRTS